MNRIERYLAQIVVSYTLVVMLVLLVIFGFFEFMNQLGSLTETYTLGIASLFTLLKLPVYSYEIFPIVLVIGTLMGLGSLANQSELTVLRVTGWSIARILWAVLKAALLMWVVIAVVGEWVAPASEAYAKKVRAEALHKSFSVGSSDGLWVKDAERYIHVERVVKSTELKNITIYEVADGQLTQLSQIKQAHYEDGDWLFKGAVQQQLSFVERKRLLNSNSSSGSEVELETDLKTGPVADTAPAESAEPLPPLLQLKTTHAENMATTFPFKPTDLQNLDIETRYLSAWNLYQYIQFLEANDLEASRFELEFWRKISMPLLVIAMIAIVFPLIFGSIRQVSMGQRVFLGVLLGMGFYLVNQLVGNLTVVYQWPVMLGAFAPAIIILLTAGVWLQRNR